MSPTRDKQFKHVTGNREGAKKEIRPPPGWAHKRSVVNVGAAKAAVYKTCIF